GSRLDPDLSQQYRRLLRSPLGGRTGCGRAEFRELSWLHEAERHRQLRLEYQPGRLRRPVGERRYVPPARRRERRRAVRALAGQPTTASLIWMTGRRSV